jgi:putative inorganic carbon (HCO3(-)) transporter
MTILVSDSAHPNVMAGSLLLLAVLVLAVFLFYSGRMLAPIRLAYGAALLPMLAILMLTQARAAWLAFALVSALMVLLRWRYGWLIVVAAALIVGVGIAIVGLPQIVDLISSSGSIEGVDGRIEIWSRAVYMIQDFPFTGVGMGSFGPVADTLYPFFLFPLDTIPHAHNLFLQLAVDLGIPGLIAWLSIYFTIIVIGWQLYRKGRFLDNLHIAGLGAAALAVQLAMGVQGMLDAVVWGMVRPAPLVWALWGFAVAAGRLYLNPAPDLQSDLPAQVGN